MGLGRRGLQSQGKALRVRIVEIHERAQRDPQLSAMRNPNWAHLSARMHHEIT